MIEFRIAHLQRGALGGGAIGSEQRNTVALDAEVSAEVAAAIHHVLRSVVEVGRARMLQFRRAVARPRQAEIVAVARTAVGLQRLDVEGVHVLHVQLQAFRRLAGVADGPAALVDFAQDVLDLGLVPALLVLDQLDVLDQFLLEAELLGEGVHQGVVGFRLEQRLYDLLAPLDRAVGGGARTGSLELGARRQQVYAVLAHHRCHRRGGGRIGVDDDQHVELLHRLDHFQAARLAVRGHAPVHHGAQVGILVDVLVLFQDAVDPARDGDAGFFHHRLRGVLALDPLVVDAPHLAPVLPGAGGKAVVAGQRIGVGTDVGGALHVVVAAEDVGAAARDADVAEYQLQDAHGADVGVADRVLGLAHAPDDGGRLVLGQHLGDAQDFGFGDAGDVLDAVRRPRHDLGLDLVEAEDAGVDVRLVFPAVLEDVIEHAPDEGNVGAGTDAGVNVGLGRGAREARIDDGHLAAVFLGMQHVQQRHRMRLGGIRADVQRRLGELHVVVGVGHGAVTPGIGDAGDRGRVADAGLVVHVVGAEEGHELAQQVSLLVAVL